MVEYMLGKRTRHSYAIEDVAYGTANDAATYSWMGIVQSISPSSKSEILQINSMDDVDSRNVSDYYETLRNYGGSIEFFVQHCRPFMLAIGDDTLTGAYIHTLTETDTLPSFTLNFGYAHTTDHAIDYTGCVVNRLSIECTKGEFMKASMEFVAQNGEDNEFRSYQSGAALKKYSTVGGVDPIRPYMYSDATVTINGTTYCPDSIKMSVNNNLLSEPCLNSGNDKRIAEPIPQLREYEANMTIKMSTDDLYDLWELGAYATTDPVITFARTTGSDQVVFTLEDAILESAISPFNISDGIVLVELPFKVKKIGIVETNSMNVDYSTAEV